jgi:hypothetical protein
MDPNYRASEDHWRFIENWPGIHGEYPGASCLLELRARIEALEAAQQHAPATEESSATAPPAPAGGLVERVAKSLAEVNSGSAPELWLSDARAAIREVASWLRSEPWIGRAAADRLEKEANQ